MFFTRDAVPSSREPLSPSAATTQGQRRVQVGGRSANLLGAAWLRGGGTRVATHPAETHGNAVSPGARSSGVPSPTCHLSLHLGPTLLPQGIRELLVLGPPCPSLSWGLGAGRRPCASLRGLCCPATRTQVTLWGGVGQV